jgi:hypothetical protein
MVASLGMSDYDTDVYAWSQRQGALLRRLAAGERVNDADLDWPNIAEEIEAVARSERGSVTSYIANIIEHLIKLEAAPANDPRTGWRTTVRRSRVRLEVLLRANPSLKRLVDDLVVEGTESGRRLAEISLTEHGEVPRIPLETLTYTADEVLGDWLPDDPQ